MKHFVLPPALEPAELIWRDGVPESTRFGEAYFSRDNGLAEARYVFIDQNGLQERFRTLGAHQHFVIAATGFGTGLNFLAAWAEWQTQRPADDNAILHFISVERFPLPRADLEKALSCWPELAAQAAGLIAQYPPLIQGAHRLVLAGGSVRLTLYFGDVLEAWRDMEFQADAWFLDGFASDLNPEMWPDEAIRLIPNHSKPGTTLATFTSAGPITRSLETAGFVMQRAPGFGDKPEMLQGEFQSGATPAPVAQQGPIAIIGAGIAGTLLARNLAERGLPVVLIDQAEQPGSAASGNPQGALYVKLGVEYNAQAQLAATALTFSQRFYRPWAGQFWHPTGLLQLAPNAQEADRQRRFSERNQYPAEVLKPVTPAEASVFAGLPVEASGLWFPASGWLEPGDACRTLARHPLIETVFGFQVSKICRHVDHWYIENARGEKLEVSQLVIAGGHESASLVPVEGELRLKTIRGQITCLPEAAYNLPDVVICGSKYVNPANNGTGVTGATFDLRDNNPEVTEESHQENLEQLEQLLPSVRSGESPPAGQLAGRVSFRCTTHDYQPVAGELYDDSGHRVPGVFMLTGLGSKGLVWAPLLAEYLADRITGQPPCLPVSLSRRVETRRLYRKRA